MRQIVAVLILISLFIVLVGTRFKRSDGDKLAAVGRLAWNNIREALPPASKAAGPIQALRHELPETIEDKVKSRLEADNRLEGIAFEVSSEGNVVTLRGVVPGAKHRTALSIAEHTVGVEKVVDELAVPAE